MKNTLLFRSNLVHIRLNTILCYRFSRLGGYPVQNSREIGHQARIWLHFVADLNTSEAQEPVAERLGVVAVHGLHLDFSAPSELFGEASRAASGFWLCNYIVKDKQIQCLSFGCTKGQILHQQRCSTRK